MIHTLMGAFRQCFGGRPIDNSARGIEALSRKAHHARAKSDLISKGFIKNGGNGGGFGFFQDNTQHPIAPTQNSSDQAEAVQAFVNQGGFSQAHGILSQSHVNPTNPLVGGFQSHKGKNELGKKPLLQKFCEDIEDISSKGNPIGARNKQAAGHHRSYDIHGQGVAGKLEIGPNSFLNSLKNPEGVNLSFNPASICSRQVSPQFSNAPFQPKGYATGKSSSGSGSISGTASNVSPSGSVFQSPANLVNSEGQGHNGNIPLPQKKKSAELGSGPNETSKLMLPSGPNNSIAGHSQTAISKSSSKNKGRGIQCNFLEFCPY